MKKFHLDDQGDFRHETLIFSVRRGPFKQEFYQCVTYGSRSAWQLQLYTIASIMLLFVLPLAVIVTAYALIFTTINRKSKEHSVLDSIQMPATRSWVTRWVSYRHLFCFTMCRKPLSRRASIMSTCSSDPSRGPVRSHLLRKAKKKSLRMSFVIVLAFMICWTPYHIIFICTTIFDMVINPIIFNYLSFVGLSNSMLNPVIYGAFQLCKVQFYSSRFVPRRPGNTGLCFSIVRSLNGTSRPTTAFTKS
ncbi:corazonin receptor [Elysia marginata]|uniref:Corazonin receptor n=1 Tax=Elysia marginata TaxID=1093978 RepID=A0AAV4F0D2_9GAST|nr:corazonin receptor [Elysia marginata]